MRFRIPPELKETITIVRHSAFERGSEIVIAADVVCMIVPRADIVDVVDGTGISGMGWVGLLEVPLPDILAGDIVQRGGGAELQIRRVRSIGTVLQLELKDDALL